MHARIVRNAFADGEAQAATSSDRGHTNPNLGVTGRRSSPIATREPLPLYTDRTQSPSTDQEVSLRQLSSLSIAPSTLAALTRAGYETLKDFSKPEPEHKPY